jgi:hypothetical protein
VENNMSAFVVISPLGRPRSEAQAERKQLGSARGRKAGFIWNQYPTTADFWARLEKEIELAGGAPVVEREYKKNTWMPLEKARFTELTAQVDYLVIGVGA